MLTWGDNGFGELGDGIRTSSDVPVQVRLPAGTTVTAISAGCFFDLALTSTGRVYAWGRNYGGSLGDGKFSAGSTVPVRVRLPAGVRVTSFGAGSLNALAVTATGKVYIWGNLTGGTPQLVHLPVGRQSGRVVAVALGALHALALTSRGVIIAWGYDYAGQLGDGKTCNCDFGPARVLLPAGVKATGIGAGFYESYAITSGNQVYAWGDNRLGQLGAGTTAINSDIPVLVALPPGQHAISIGGGPNANHGLAVTVAG